MENESFLNLLEYTKKEKIGEGSFGKVYIVQKKSSNEIYAAKISKQEIQLSSNKEILSIAREVNIISKLQHPTILKFIGYSQFNFKKESKPVIITEFSPNGSLGHILELERKNMKIDGWDQTKKMMVIYGIASGMSYLHSNSIVHRDLKPDNIFLDDYLCPKIADFGLSKTNNSSINISSLKSTTGTIGTPAYMAPEIWSSQSYTPSSDVYAFSLIIFEILTGEEPFSELDFFQIINKVALEKYRPSFKKEIPKSYQNLIESCWSHMPSDRPTFADIVSQLKTDPTFILEGADKNDYLNYIDFIEKSQIEFNTSKNVIHLSDIIGNTKSKSFKKTKINFSEVNIKKQDTEKIIESEKIIETKPFTEQNLKFVSSSIFNDLNDSCRDLVVKAEEGLWPAFIAVSLGFIEGRNGFPRETKTGISMLEYGVNKDNIECIEIYSSFLNKGDYIPKNQIKSEEVLEKAMLIIDQPKAKFDRAIFLLSKQTFCIESTNDEVNYYVAKKYSQSAAESGDIDSMLLYASLSTKQKENKYGAIYADFSESVKYYKLAAENGNPTAMAMYGNYLETGLLTGKPDFSAAINYYRMSYEKKDLTGYAFLGYALYNGLGDLFKNAEDGAKLIKYSSKKKNPYGMLANSILLIKDPKMQLSYLQKLCNIGNPEGIMCLGLSYLGRKNFEKNIELGRKYLKLAVEEGSIRAAFELGKSFSLDDDQIKSNLDIADYYLKYAADNNYPDALSTYPDFLSKLENSKEKASQIEKYLKIGISINNVKCFSIYGRLLMKGDVLPQNSEEAVKYLKFAADNGDKNSSFLYSEALRNGIGVEKNVEEALNYKVKSLEPRNTDCFLQ